MTAPAPISRDELDTFLAAHPAWTVDGRGMLSRTYEAATFLGGIDFVHAVARVAEAADHHPDIDIRWKRVTLSLITHDAGNAITALDTRLAAEFDLIFATRT